MEKEKPEDFTVEKLNKRKRLIVIVLTFVTIAGIAVAATFIYLIIIGDLSNLTFLIPGMISIFFIPYFYVGLKKTNAELVKRNQT